ncbi:MAG: 2OG-Fe(II) oxygenase [Archangiaceae bacterium]|nr:2OG-Fe(II) oxygenase [Archangiaceae bacterium]
MAEYRRTRNALPEGEFVALRDAVLGSKWVAKSQLNGSFQTSRGFGMIFTEAGRPQVLEQLPQLAPFLEAAMQGPAEKRLQPFWKRGQPPRPNAWYLNLLLVGAAGGVGTHIDGTLAGPAQVELATPRVVSVLYLQVPKCRGGELVLARGAKLKGVIHPTERTLVHFRGDLEHQVRALVNPAPDAARASLVLEQYHFAPEALARLPTFRLDSRARFRLALEAAAQRPAPPLDFEKKPPPA